MLGPQHSLLPATSGPPGVNPIDDQARNRRRAKPSVRRWGRLRCHWPLTNPGPWRPRRC